MKKLYIGVIILCLVVFIGGLTYILIIGDDAAKRISDKLGLISFIDAGIFYYAIHKLNKLNKKQENEAQHADTITGHTTPD